LRQEHKHRVNEERVVVNDDDTSVPLKRHLHSPIALGARRRRPICASTSDRELAKGALAAIICARPATANSLPLKRLGLAVKHTAFL
jgi:hypothetical protein